VAIIATPLTASVGVLSRRSANARDLKRVGPLHWNLQRADIGTCHTEMCPVGRVGALCFRPAVRRSRGWRTLRPGFQCHALKLPTVTRHIHGYSSTDKGMHAPAHKQGRQKDKRDAKTAKSTRIEHREGKKDHELVKKKSTKAPVNTKET